MSIRRPASSRTCRKGLLGLELLLVGGSLEIVAVSSMKVSTRLEAVVGCDWMGKETSDSSNVETIPAIAPAL